MPTVTLGVPYKEDFSEMNTKIVMDAVKQRFPEWADHCEPYVNVLSLKAWNQRGFRVKKGEKAIRVATMIPVWKEDEKSGERVQVGTRPWKAHVFALPQVEHLPHPNTSRHFGESNDSSMNSGCVEDTPGPAAEKALVDSEPLNT